MKKFNTISKIPFVNNFNKQAFVELEMSCLIWNTMLELIICLIRNYFAMRGLSVYYLYGFLNINKNPIGGKMFLVN